MRIAFYAPLKPPYHAVPSGDRRMARLLMAALRKGGHQVELASRLRTYDRYGDERRQRRLRAFGKRVSDRLLRRYMVRPPAQRPAAWFTYHLYHKAPDWLGPTVAKALAIPYLVAEASHAPKRRNGPWAVGFDGAMAALAQADAVVGFNLVDAVCVRPMLKAGARIQTIRPFLNLMTKSQPGYASRADLAADRGIAADVPWLLTVAMMRSDKLASYQLLGMALSGMLHLPWRLLVAGDGDARTEVAAALAPLGARVHWMGAVDHRQLAALHAACDMMVWPAVKEAYGMALLEAQAAGLPVVAGNAGGVSLIVRHGQTGLLAPEGDMDLFCQAIAALLEDPLRREIMGDAARCIARAEHGIETAARILDDLLREDSP